MRLILTLVVSLFFAAETQAGFLFGRCRPQPQCYNPCPQFYYYECYPVQPCVPCPILPCDPPLVPAIPVIEEEKATLSEEASGGSVPLLGYLDWGIPPTGHETYFGGGSTFVPTTTFFVPPPRFGGFGGFGGGWGRGGGGGDVFYGPTILTTINYGDTIINYGDTIIDYGDTIINPPPTCVPCPWYPPGCDHPICHNPLTCPPKGHCPPGHTCPPGGNPCDDPCNDKPDCDVHATPAPGSVVLLASALPCGLFYWLRKKLL